MNTNNFVVKSLELHLFFGRIMKEHSFFLKAGFTPANPRFSEKAEFFIREFEKLLCRAVTLSDGVVGRGVLCSGEVVTDFTAKAEKQTERFTGIPINKAITAKELRLCSGELKCDKAAQLAPQVKRLNQTALRLLDGLISFKESILKNVLDCEMFTLNYPLLIEHILREARRYRQYVEQLEREGDLCDRSMREIECFWNRIMMEHAMFIRGLLGDRSQLTVAVGTTVDSALLHVTCSDNYGNVVTKDLDNGRVVFTDLLPNTMYKIQLNIDGFHKLVGQTSDIFTTDTTTNIVTFTAVTGPEDGSVMLNFTVDGDEPEEWTVVYQADGEEEHRQVFTGHSVSVSGLSVGKVYTFTLDAGKNLSLSGKDTLSYMASRLILAQDLTVTSSGGSDITIRWNAPGDIVVESWSVRCYSESGYEEQRTVSDTEVYLTGIDPTVSYTVEVTAAGMTQPARTSITANPINITALNVEDSDSGKLTVRWDYAGSDPAGGWLLMYTIDGSDSKNVVKCDTASAVITPQIPGAKYQFTIHAADTTSIFSNVHTYTCPQAESFEENGLAAADITVQLLKTPEDPNWSFEDVESDAFTDRFASGDPISIVLHGASDFYLPGYETAILYVIRDAHGNVLPDWVSQDTVYWKDIWSAGDRHYGELDLPQVPTDAGTYSLGIYFNGKAVASLDFTITE